MKLSMWTSYFFDLPPETALQELAQAGWHFAELSDEHSRVLLDRGDPGAVGAAFRSAAGEIGVALEQGHLDLPLNIAPADEGQRRAAVDGLKPWLDLYCAIGITAGVLHPGGCEDAAVAQERRLQSLAEIAEHLQGTDLVISIENCSSGRALDPILAATSPERVGVCLDTGHLNLTDEDQGEFIRRVGPRLRALHLAENAGQSDEHTMPFARGGSVPWAGVVDALRDVQYQGLHNFEIPGENRCPLPVRRLKLGYLKALASWIFDTPPGPATAP